MDIYETISWDLPFHKDTCYTISLKVVEGERPPRGVNFMDCLWQLLKLCWAPQPNYRPRIEEVHQWLEIALNLLESPSPGSDTEMETDVDDEADDSGSSGSSSAIEEGASSMVIFKRSVSTPPSSIPSGPQPSTT